MFFSILKFWFSMLSGGWKDRKWPKMTKMSVCCTLYFRNHVSYDLHLWYTCMYKRIISTGIFHFLSKFWFSRSLGGRGCKEEGSKSEKTGPKWQKILSVSFRVSGTVQPGFYQSTLLSSVAPWVGPMVDTEGKILEI